MALEVKQRSYKDHLGRTIPFPVANQADTGEYIIDYSVFFGTYASQNSPIQVISGANAILQLSVGTWDDLGITSGDTITFSLTNQEGTTTASGTTTVLIADGTDLKISAGAPFSFTSMNGYIYSNKTPQSVEYQFNLVPPTQNNGFESIIDNTVATLYYNGVSSLSAGGSANLTQIGNLSGSIINSATILRQANQTDPISGGTVLNYRITLNFKWHGYLSAFLQDFFFDVKTVTPLVKCIFYPQFNNQGINLTNIFKLQNDGNSGFRDENFNQGVDNFTVDTFLWKDGSGNPIGAFDFSQPTQFEFEVTSLGGFGTNFGLIFFNDIDDLDLISASPTSNNGTFNHARHTILAETATLTATTGQSFSSVLGTNGEQLDFTDIEISIAGATATVTGTITPNALFANKFLDENNINNKFAMLFRCETSTFTPSNYSTTVNKTAWTGVGEVAPIVLGSFDFNSIAAFDHAKRNLGDSEDIIIIEDDNRLVIEPLLNKDEQHTSFILRNIAKNTVTGDYFYLESYFFDFDQTIQVDGTQNISFNQETYFNQQPSAANRAFLLNRYPVIDTPTQYGLKVTFPFVQRWEYWIPQNNANIAFYNNANKDWRNYNQVGDWTLAMRLEILTPVGSYINDYPYQIEDYDHNPNLTHEWSFERLNGTPITNPLIGEVVKVISTWTAVSGTISPYWSALTVEPFEASKRYLISTEYVQGSQPLNPLIPLTGAGDKLSQTGAGTSVVVLESLFDPNRINGQSGVSFTSRINGNGYTLQERTKKEFNLVQLPNAPENQGRGAICCDCEPEKVLASSTENDLLKNDIKSVFHKLDDLADTCEFKIYKDGNATPLPNYGIVSTFPNDAGLVGFTYNWRDYLINHGGGCYTIKKEITAAGIAFEIEIGHYKLYEYSADTSEGTTRIIGHYNKEVQWVENGALKRANFSDSNFEDCYRFKGYFGSWQPNPEVINHYAYNGMLRNAKIRYKGSYALIMNATTICSYEKLTKGILLFSSILKCSDHNWSNPNQRAEIIWTVLNDEQSIDIEYNETSRKASVVVGLKDMFNNEVSRFDGSINAINGVTFQLSTIGTSGSGGVCTPANVEAKNSDGTVVDSDTFASGSSGILNAPDATAVVKTISGVTVVTVSIPSGESEDIIIADPNDVDLTINSNTFITATSPSQDIGLEDTGAVDITDYTTLASTVTIGDSDITLNSGSFLSVKATRDQDIELVDQDDVPIVPLSVIGNVVKVDTGGAIGATLMKSGRVTSNNTGDDGDEQEGRDISWFILDGLNPFGNNKRHTGITGGYYDQSLAGWYDKDGVATTEALAIPNDIIIDWSTYNGSTVLGVYRTLLTAAGLTSQISAATALTVGGYSSGWRVNNIVEHLNFYNWQYNGDLLNWEPLGISGQQIWTNTNIDASTTFFTRAYTGSPIIVGANGSSYSGMVVRTFTVSGTTLT